VYNVITFTLRKLGRKNEDHTFIINVTILNNYYKIVQTKKLLKNTVIFLKFLQVCFVINCLKNVIYHFRLRMSRKTNIFFNTFAS